MFVSPIPIAPRHCSLYRAAPPVSGGYYRGEPIYMVLYTSPYKQQLTYAFEYWNHKYGGYHYPDNPTGRVRCVCIHHLSEEFGKDGHYDYTNIGRHLYRDEK